MADFSQQHEEYVLKSKYDKLTRERDELREALHWYSKGDCRKITEKYDTHKNKEA